MSKKWDRVVGALGHLYDQYYRGKEIDDAVKYLMETYDEWLDGGDDAPDAKGHTNSQEVSYEEQKEKDRPVVDAWNEALREEIAQGNARRWWHCDLTGCPIYDRM